MSPSALFERAEQEFTYKLYVRRHGIITTRTAAEHVGLFCLQIRICPAKCADDFAIKSLILNLAMKKSVPEIQPWGSVQYNRFNFYIK